MPEIVETAIWITGAESQKVRKRYEADVREAFDSFAESRKIVFGPIRFEEKLPGEERVPEVPKHIEGPNIKLLVASAEILGKMQPVDWFTKCELEPDDLSRLRKITRKAYNRLYPWQPRLTDRQCDTIINDLGPETAMDELRRASHAEMH